ncbi:restriction endonuclease subunit S [Helicobacter sp. NHP22-001]|uniref:restriction endonuclease subunit S n=1 Tax=Helicobacter sp. NHP22-001 TaxID=3040202 RepID=UPI00244D8E6A|nr:restriction endonuclease subunit S [Helicobacter sp. NHP22-001]GMB96354.1 N-6 DNA methylase [Helicobacter sp. NHP22-001]
MITEHNLKDILKTLGFKTPEGEVFECNYPNNAQICVDFKHKKITYAPQDESFKEGDYPSNDDPSTGFIIHRNTTTNFNSNENFVCLVAVHKLLEKGYAPEHIILEPTFKVGHGQKAYGDILVLDQEFKPLVLIENKTYGEEFNKEWDNMQKNGGQLFSYYAVHKVPYLCLLAFVDANEHAMYLICTKDNQEHLKRRNEDRKESEKLRGFDDPANGNAKDYFEVWSQTYSSAYVENGIFEPDIQAYQIGKEKYSLKDLKAVSINQINRIYHEFATILRHHSIGNYENSFYVLVDLFLCKVVDEIQNEEDLQFMYKGAQADNPIAYCDRLLDLYARGVENLFNKKVVNVKKDEIAKLFDKAKRYTGKFKKDLDALFDKQKYFNIKKFNFVEVENEEEFYLNFKVLVQVVGLIQSLHLMESQTNQFLGDLFEGFLNRHIHQTEGRFFTPTPITNFIIHSLPTLPPTAKMLDFACGAGHFLSEFMVQHKDAKVYGIEKNKDLSKVSKLACIFNSKTHDNRQSTIIFQDALDKITPTHKDDFALESFDLILSNPPYSVSGFLSTLDASVIKDFKVSSCVESKSYKNNDNIECFFIERAGHFLKEGGLFALILPVSILDTTSEKLFIETRALLLEHFKILSIVRLNSRTFGSTGTETIILYAQKVKKFHNDLINALVEGIRLDDDFKQHTFLQEYCAFRGYPLEDFKVFLKEQSLSPELKTSFKEYLDDLNADKPKIFKKPLPQESLKQEWFKLSPFFNTDLKQAHKTKQSAYFKSQDYQERLQAWQEQEAFKQIHALELEKMRLFASVQGEEVLVLKSPQQDKDKDKDKKEKKDKRMKAFLGYSWSKRKGDEGIKYNASNNPNNKDNANKDPLEKLQSAKDIQTPLYNPKDADDPTKLAHALKSFMGSILANTPILDLSRDLDKDLSGYLEKYPAGYQLFSTPLREMLDFSKATLDKVINLNPKREAVTLFMGRWEEAINPFEGGKWELVPLGELLTSVGKGKRPASFENANGAFDFYKSSLEVSKCESYDFDMEALIIGDGGSANIHYTKGKFASSDHTYIFGGGRPDLHLKYAYLVLRHHLELLEAGFKGVSGRKNISKTFMMGIKIPLPPLEVQEHIIAECAKIEKRYQEVRMGIEQYKALIQAVLEACGVCGAKNGGGGGVESALKILETLATLSLEPVPTDPKLEELKNLVQTLPSLPARGWDLVKLGEVCSLEYGKALQENKRKEGAYPVMGSNGIVGYHNAYLVKAPCIIVGRKGSAGKVTYSEKDCYPIDTTFYVETKLPYNIKLLYFVLQGLELEKSKIGIGVPGINRSDIYSLKIPFPPLEAQEQIISVLTQIEQEIACLDQEIAALEGQEQEILKEFLGKEREREIAKT